MIDWIFRRSGARKSLNNRMRTAQSVLVLLMLIPAIVSISLMVVFSGQYHSVIAQMRKVSSLMPLIQDQLLIEMSDIVVGRTRFEDGAQYQKLSEAEALLDQLIDEGAASHGELEVAKRTLSTLKNYIDQLGEQIASEALVDDNMRLQEEIGNVGALFVEMLQDSINAEILAAGEASNHMQTVIRTTLVLELALLLLTLTFAMLAQRSLTRAIQGPIDRLKLFAGRIASGELSERAEPPEVEELDDLTHSLNTMAYKLEQLIRENRAEQENLKKSELRALQAQITPHFLYNTLDAIIWLAESKRYAEVIEITGALSGFYRTSLNNGKDWITIGQEKEHLLGYLTILRVRYRDILKYELEIDESLSDCEILKLSIQPLVENAVYHGIKNRRGGGLVQISIRRQGQRMRVEVRDSGAGMDEQTLSDARLALLRSEPMGSESGYGLFSVDKRIKLYYNQPEGLHIDSVKGEGTVASFSVPVK